ncbi:MAG: YggT family protein [Chitinispirillaceae bacterium]
MSPVGLVHLVFRAASILIFARVILSWIPSVQNSPAGEWVYRLTEPLLEPLRRLIPSGSMGIDFTPIIALLLLRVLEFIVVQMLLAL